MFDPLELNYSKIRAYLDCPYLFRFIYTERKFAPQFPQSSLGLSVHRALARYHDRGRDLSDLLAHYDDAWLHHGYASAQQAMEFHARGRAILEKWWDYERTHKGEILYWEQKFDFPFEKWTIKGTIDRVDKLSDGSVEVIDYKLGLEGRTEGDVAGSLQLAIYALGMSRAFRAKVGAVAYMVLTGPQKLSCAYDPSSEEKTLSLIRETAERMLALDMYRKGNCARCVIRKLCPESLAKES